MARCSKSVGRNFKVGVGRNGKGQFCGLGKRGCSRDSALASSIRGGLKRTSKGEFC